MRILTWNVNGLSSTLQYYPWSETKTFKGLLDGLNADIICFQEVKCQRNKLTRDMALVPGYYGYFSFSKSKLGYSGVSVYIKTTLPQPRQVHEGITGILHQNDNRLYDDNDYGNTPAALLDAEGRCLLLEFESFVLLNIYFPNESNETRSEFKMDYHRCVQKRVAYYLNERQTQVILVGDVNAVHEEIDHCDPAQSIKEHGLMEFKELPQRRWLDNIIHPKGPLVDMTRLYHPQRKKMFTCWNTKINARPSNFGTRIDYILVSKGLESYFKYADIQADVLGSDHCPVYADFLPFPEEERQQESQLLTFPQLSINFPEFKQNKLLNYFSVAPKTKKDDKRKLTEEQHLISSSSSSSSNKRSRIIETSISNSTKTKQQWALLFQAPQVVPRCKVHQLPCVEKTVTKKGPNIGKKFYLCAKPVGPKDSSMTKKEDYSCNFFQWK